MDSMTEPTPLYDESWRVIYTRELEAKLAAIREAEREQSLPTRLVAWWHQPGSGEIVAYAVLVAIVIAILVLAYGGS